MVRRCAVALAVLVVSLSLVVTSADAQGAPLGHEVAAFVGDVGTASGVVYDASTEAGLGLDALKVIQGPQPGTYLGVFHDEGPSGYFVIRLALSNDLSTWVEGPVLSWRGSMPTIAAAGPGYLVAFERADPGGKSQIEIEYFGSYNDLLAARPARVVRLPRRLSTTNEGTPSFRSIDLTNGVADSRLVLGFHYNTGDGIDRDGVGVLIDFSKWTERQNVGLNKALESDGVHGSIGARNTVEIDDTRVQLVEGQEVPGRWGAWRIYAYLPTYDIAVKVPISTPRGAHLSIGVPRASIVENASGETLLVFTAFVYEQGSPPETRGELLWWRAT